MKGDNPPLVGISRADATEFLNAIAKLHPHWGRSPKTKSLTVREVLEKFSGDEGLSNRTLNRYAIGLGGVWKWARRRGHYDGENPFSDQSRKLPNTRQTGWLTLTTEELQKLFSASLLVDTPTEERLRPSQHIPKTAMMWLPLISLYSGMRQDEGCQLRVEDVKQEDGIWFFNIQDQGEGQSVKTDAGSRQVPVHSAIIDSGFLQYLDHVAGDPSGKLFPGLRPGGPDGKMNWYFTKRFTEFRRSLEINRPRVGFHSLRKNAVTALERAGVPENEAAEVIGHEKGFTYKHYSGGLTLHGKRDVVQKIQYPGLDLNHLRP